MRLRATLSIFRALAPSVGQFALSVLLVLTVPSLPAREKWRSVKGAALPDLFAGKEFGDGVHFAYQFELGGTFTGTEMGKDVRGLWRVRKDELCWKWQRPSGAEECYLVQRDGNQVRLMRDGCEAWYGRLHNVGGVSHEAK